MTIALICPDAFSVLLFCKGIIRQLQALPGAAVIVVSDEGSHGAALQALGVRSVHVPMHRFVAPGQDVRYAAALWRVLRRERCDLVLNFSTKSNIYGSFAARLARVPRVVCHVVGLGAAFVPSTGVKGVVLRGVVHTLYAAACRLSDGVWFTNRNDLEYFVRHRLVSRPRTVLTRNYLDTDAYAPAVVAPEEIEALRRELGIEDGARIVVMVARMIWSKGVREFAEAAERLAQTHPDAVFLLVAPPEEGHFEAVPPEYIRGVEQRSRLRWLGFRTDVKRIYAAAELGVLVSYYKEGGYPRGLLEPMSMGKPIIAADTPDCRETVEQGRNGFLVSPRDSVALAERIACVLDDEGLRRRLGAYSREKAVRDFDERPIVATALRALGILPESPSFGTPAAVPSS
jgi:glycosyltransferase involved in cell wall biosynthesis